MRQGQHIAYSRGLPLMSIPLPQEAQRDGREQEEEDIHMALVSLLFPPASKSGVTLTMPPSQGLSKPFRV